MEEVWGGLRKEAWLDDVAYHTLEIGSLGHYEHDAIQTILQSFFLSKNEVKQINPAKPVKSSNIMLFPYLQLKRLN